MGICAGSSDAAEEEQHETLNLELSLGKCVACREVEGMRGFQLKRRVFARSPKWRIACGFREPGSFCFLRK